VENTFNKSFPKIGRNDLVSVKYQDGMVLKDVKYKKVEDDIKLGKCKLL
jgi:preprotein translocase subunit SecA